MSIWAIVPVKPLKRSKSRLAPVLSIEDRQAFSKQLLAHTLDVLGKVSEIKKVLVVSRDPSVLRVAREHNAHTVTESGAPELNEALARATDFATTFGADSVLVVPTDLPLLSVSDVQVLIASVNSMGESVVLAPDRHETGTNAIFLRPPRVVPFVFGPNSFAHYLSLVRDRGVEVHICRTQGFMLDVDTPEDLELYRKGSFSPKQHSVISNTRSSLTR